MRFFQNHGHFHLYFGQKSSKIGGNGGHMVFLASDFSVNFGHFRHEKFCDSGNSFSCESVLTQTILIHNRKNFHHSNLWSQRGFLLGGQNPCFVLRSKVNMKANTPGQVVLILVPNRNCTRKHLGLGLSLLRNHIS